MKKENQYNGMSSCMHSLAVSIMQSANGAVVVDGKSEQNNNVFGQKPSDINLDALRESGRDMSFLMIGFETQEVTKA